MTARTAAEIRAMEKAGRIAAEALKFVGGKVRPGVSTLDLDLWADDFISSRGATSACTGYYGYPRATCISVNDVVCHGLIPGSEITVFRTGDGSLSAQYEHTILITDGQPQVLTRA